MKTIADFYADKRYRQGVSKTCRSCVAITNSQRDKAKMSSAGRRWLERQDPAVMSARGRRHNLKRHFGLTPEDYDRMLVAQNGVCAICHRPETMTRNNESTTRALAVDHDADTGRVRGLLCGRCNLAIGYLFHDIERLRSAMEYLAFDNTDSSAKPPLVK